MYLHSLFTSLSIPYSIYNHQFKAIGHYQLNSASLPNMARNNFMLSKALALLWLTGIVLIEGKPHPWSPFQAPKELALKLTRNPQTLSLASTDFGLIVHEKPLAVLEPTSADDISDLIKYSNSLPIPFTIAPRGQAHSTNGQAMTHDGVVVNMTQLNGFRNGSRIIVSDGKCPLGYYADVGGEQIWNDVFRATLAHGTHSANGQAMTHDGVAVNMTQLNGFRNDSRIIVSDGKCPLGYYADGKCPLGYYADVGGEQIWNDVLRATLAHGLTPLSWTDYLYLSVGGTLSNAGISGRSFRFGPQISNVLELDVVTGNGDLVTCSMENNSKLFHAVLGGLGQFGVITRARIALGHAPTRVKWLRLLYNDFSAYSGDQEHLISLDERNDPNALDFVEGSLLLNEPSMDLFFYPTPDQPRITSLVTQYGIIYILELVKYYDNNSQAHVKEEIAKLVKGLKFVPTFVFEKDVSYEDFMNRVHAYELLLKSKGLWDVPHADLDILIPRSRISDFNEGVFKGIILKPNITTGGFILVYPMNRNKWDERMSAVTPDEDIFYLAAFRRSIGFDQVEAFLTQNQQILQFCKDAGIKFKEYLPTNKTHQEWVEHFGSKWQLFEDRKAEFDPKRILSPGQGIFN